MSVQRKTRTYDGANIEYFEHGSGPLTLFFQHGWGNAADIWDIFFADYLDLTGLVRFCTQHGVFPTVVAEPQTQGMPHSEPGPIECVHCPKSARALR